MNRQEMQISALLLLLSLMLMEEKLGANLNWALN